MPYSIAIGTAKLKWLTIIMLLLLVILATVYTTYSFRAKRCKYAYPLICPLNIHCPDQTNKTNTLQYTFKIKNIPRSSQSQTLSIGFQQANEPENFTFDIVHHMSIGALVTGWDHSLGVSVLTDGMCYGYYLRGTTGDYKGASISTFGLENNVTDKQSFANMIYSALTNKKAEIFSSIGSIKHQLKNNNSFVINLNEGNINQSLCITASSTQIIGSTKIPLNISQNYQSEPTPIITELKRIKTQLTSGCASNGPSHLCTCVDPSYETNIYTCDQATWCPSKNWYIFGDSVECHDDNIPRCSNSTYNNGCSAPFCRSREAYSSTTNPDQTYQANVGKNTAPNSQPGGIASLAGKNADPSNPDSYTINNKKLSAIYTITSGLNNVQYQKAVFCRGHTYEKNNIGGEVSSLGTTETNTEKPIHARFPNSTTSTGNTIILGFN